MWLEISIAALIIGYIIYKLLTSKFDHFEKLGIPYVKPIILIGSIYGFVFKKESFREEFLRKYKEFKDEKAFGIFEGSDPVLVINDLELLKKITVKDFEYFKNHKSFTDAEDDPLFGNSLLQLNDDKWHDMRTTLSPVFTGRKMRLMFQLILDICERAVKFLDINIKNKSNSNEGVDFEMKDFFTLYTNDAIASTAFGLDVNSLEDNNNQFYRMGKQMISFPLTEMLKFLLYNTFKKIFRFCGIKMSRNTFNNYFYKLVVDAMKYRKENNIVRQDMIHMLMEAQSNPDKSHDRKWTNEELVAQCFIFLFAGLESVSTTLCFATQELIENQDVQEKLRQEIDLVNEKLNGGPLTYEILNEMKYMDMFMSEVLRIWPPFIQTDRICTKPYKIDEDNLKVNLEVNDIVWIPIVGLHLNEEHFSNPLKFDPERFNDENKSNIKQMSYVPFGYGPRICIGSRLALLECKAILFYILKSFKLDVSVKTNIPVKLAPVGFPVLVQDGFWLKMIPRKRKQKMLLEISIAIAIISFLSYKWLTAKFDHFEKLGIPYVKPVVLLGSFTGMVFKRESFREEFLRKYEPFKNEKIYGVFEGRDPMYVVNDLELLKKITIKDFEHFRNHKGFVEAEDDPLFGHSLFSMKDDKWHDMRTTLSPAFTGRKMRLMLQLILETCEKAVKHLESNIKSKPNPKDGIEFEMKEFFSRFTNDAIASVAFGLEVNSLEDENNQFYEKSKKIASISAIEMIKLVLYNMMKKVFRLFKIKMLNEEFNNYFYRLVVDAMKYRKENNIIRNDMINMLMEAQLNPEKSHDREWTNEELVAQCFIFLFAGLESVSTTLCFATQELIENLDIQQRLREEIDLVNEKLNGGPLTYETLKEMKYMEMVLSEVLRKWSPSIISDRICTKEYKIDEDDIKLNLNVGDAIWLPVVGLHLNDQHFPEPYKFDPERFSEENKGNIKPMSYAPFGFGPRGCIASRLALMECKAILFYILTNFELCVSKKTKIPVELESVSFTVSAKGGFWLKMIPRK
ncbi:uncharacterized protein LOC129612012 [Condylostylus longicornis]|uniref:uncharacterized protein LOC129612012 n=1 Tax=Condylostylus longicornis TaxID=2530218 RepID=UPI00244DFA78|nr:uncharacterized protein LOC129612012 [Condylostylus longicornis]